MPARSDAFHTTRWTRVCIAKAGSDEGQRALADLCDAYYEPVVAFLRCELRDADAAREMAHAFFADMLRGGTIQGVDPERGRFRSYLLGAVKHFIGRQRDHALRLKRGGGAEHVEMDESLADAAQRSPDAAFDRQWAMTLLGHALETLSAECTNAEFFAAAKPWLMGDAGYGDQSALATQCGMSAAAFKMAVHRLRHRFRECVKAEIADTLEPGASVAEEMASLFAALS
jgi:DNA-directed RNA polymerase specialized sigma24 family protein